VVPWRRLTQIAAYRPDPLVPGKMIEAEAKAMVDTYPETPWAALWAFKLRVGNRNGFYGDWTPEVVLCSAALPGIPRQLRHAATESGRARFSWFAPLTDGHAPVQKYTVCCGDGGACEDALNFPLAHTMVRALAVGIWTCEVRAVNAVGPGPAASVSVRVI